GTTLMGFLGFDVSRSKICFDVETIDILMIVAGLIAGALQKRMNFQEIDKHRHNLELLVSERTANLERAEAKYRLIATNSHDVIWTMDKTMKTTYMSPSVEKHLGYTPEEYLKLSIEERLPAESNLKVKQIVSDTLAKLQKGEFRKDEAVVFEMLHRCKNGTEMWGEVSFILLFDETGAISGFHGVTRNIHQRKLAEHALHESRKQFMALVENTSDWIWEVDPTDRFTYSNPMVEKIIGYKPEEVIGQVYSDFLDPAEKERVVSTFLNFRDARVPFQKVSFTIIHRNGKKVKLESSGVPVQNYDGVFIGYRGILRDVTESTLEDESLRQMQNKHRHHLRNTQLGYIEWDINKEVIEWNQSAERIFGYLKMQAISEKIFYKIIPPELHDDIDKIWSQIVEGCKPVAMINDNLNREGDVIVCSWHNTPLLNDQGELVAVASLVEDITDTERVKQGNPHIIQTFEHWENGVILFKSRLKILAANAVARNLLGISVSETNNHNLSSFFDKEELMKLKKNLLPLVVRNNVWNGSLLIKTNKGVQLVQSAIQRHFNPESQSLIFIMMFPASK
ncbi:MAG TPA: PAS domain S-box protein, partial [Bacteroidales bacterium]|nr:PAS domain S-box protein [Bacteroidales bacterium]